LHHHAKRTDEARPEDIPWRERDEERDEECRKGKFNHPGFRGLKDSLEKANITGSVEPNPQPEAQTIS